jgi:hypothetical protein
MRIRFPVLGCSIAVLLASCAPAPKTPPPPPPPPISSNTGTRLCVQLGQIRESRVVSDSVIDFVMIDGTTLRNTLPFPCPGLGMNRAFGYATSINQLCNTSTITVIVQGGGPVRGATCGLGVFVPYTPPARGAVPK